MVFASKLSRHLIHILCILIFTTTALHAAPYGPNGRTIEWTQPDGTKLTLRVFGDEFYGRTETTDGYTVIFDPATHAYHYATLSADGNEFTSTGKHVGKVNPKTLGIAKRLEINPNSRATKARMKHDAHEAIVNQQARWDAVKAANRNYEAFKNEVRKQEKAGKKGFVIPMGTIFPDSQIPTSPAPVSPASGTGTTPSDPSVSPSPPSFTISGNIVGLTILIDFSDVPGTVVTQSQVDDFCNKPNYTGFSNAGSVYDYFFIQSGGKLRYNNTVTYYVRVPQPKTYYNVTTTPCGTCGSLLLNDALNILIANGYDFSKLSTKSGGYIRACNVFFAGADSGVWSYGLWPHRSSITPRSVGGGKYVSDYQISEIGTTPSLNIGTICHENGHMLLGYPDLYSYDGNAATVGNFSLMDGGNYGGSPAGTHPVNIDAYLKSASGWINVIDLDSTSHQRCTLQVDGNQFYRYRNPSKSQEYFLFEVRDNTGYEGPYGGQTGSVNPSAGLVAYHVNETGTNTNSSIFTPSATDGSVPTGKVAHDFSTPYELLLVEANPATLNPYMTYWYEKPSPDSADAFKSTGKNQISDATSPELKFWDSTGRNTTSNCNINTISADSSDMSFIIGAGALGVTPSIVLSRSTIDNYCNFGATAAPKTFILSNGQDGTVNYTITCDQSWLSCTPTTGTATTGDSVITVNFATSGLAAGSYVGTITVTDPASSPSTKTITVNLTVTAQPVIALSIANFITNGIAGTPGPQTSFNINNTGGGSVDYTISKTQPWLSITPNSGTVVGETDTIYVNFDASVLAAGTYNDTITVTAPSASNPILTIPVTFSVDGPNMILAAPNGGENWIRGSTQTITWASGIGGNVKLELLKNGVLNSTIIASTPNNGSYNWSIPANQALGANYQVRITSVETPSISDLSLTAFTISLQPIYTATMDTNPGWTLQGAWAWGQPTGTSGDPSSGHTGNNVIGYNLNGAYTDNLPETHATTPAIDCSNRINVQLSFYRWLGVESGNYDKAYVRVSNDGTNWTNVYAHNTSADGTLQESAWSLQTYNISAIADKHATVYVRWTMGTTDGSVHYAGWNVDDVVITGDLADGGSGVVITPSGGSTDVTEGGATDTYTVRLATQPTANVTVNITPDSQVTVSPTSLTFTPANWNTDQTVTVTAVDDTLNEFAHTGTINHSATSTDANYNAISIDGLLVNITDNDNIPPVVNAGIDQSVPMSGLTWTPADTGPIVWYDANDASTITQTSGAVSQWTDKVGTCHMVQATSSKRPLTGTTTINGVNAISFDGIDDALKTATNPFGTSINNAMMIGVFNIGTINTGTTLFSLTGSSATANRWQSHAPWSDGNLYFDCGGASGANRISIASGWSANQNKMLGYYCSITDNVQQVWVDGSNFLSDATGHTVNTVSGISLGHDGASSYDNCLMGEVLVINNTVSAINRQKLEGYLANKWGLTSNLPANHPYKIQPPSNAIAVANLSGTASDPNGDPITTLWTVVSGPGTVTFGNAHALHTTATFTIAGTYTLRLTASDPGVSTTDDVIITINPSPDFAVTYAGNNHSSGTPPLTQDKTPGGYTVIASNNGSMTKTGYYFAGWNTAANGSGTNYTAGSLYSTNANLTLYAKWLPNAVAGALDHFAISSITSTQTVSTPITGITITAQDASNNTVTSFTGNVTFGGTGGFSGTSANFTAGILSNVSVTPTIVGNILTLTVNDGASHSGSTTILTIQTLYNGWSNNAVFTADANGDGITNGLAWVLGATDPSANATSLLPSSDNTSDANYFIYSYRRSDAANSDPNTTISVQYGSDLSGWTTAVHDGTNIIITTTPNGYSPGVARVDVKIKRTLAPSGKIFTRLKVVTSP